MNTIKILEWTTDGSISDLSPFSNIFRVIVQTTPGLDVAVVTVATSDEASSVQENCDPSNRLSPPPSNFELFARDGFDISWCQYVVRCQTRCLVVHE